MTGPVTGAGVLCGYWRGYQPAPSPAPSPAPAPASPGAYAYLVHNRYHGTAPEGAVYVGRGPGARGQWGNRFQITETDDRDTVVARHRTWLLSDADALARVRTHLAGKHLVCFCAPKACHADALAWVANCPDAEYETLVAAAQTGGMSGDGSQPVPSYSPVSADI